MTKRMRAGALALAFSIGASSVTPVNAAMIASEPLTFDRLDSWYADWPLKDGVPFEKAMSQVRQMIEALNQWIVTSRDIRVFREWRDDDAVVKDLVPLAADVSRAVRVPATLILGNVVDNTNVCYILDYVTDTEEIDPNGLYNLFQVVLQVSSYAFEDTAEWIRTTNREVGNRLLANQKNSFETLRLLDDIDTTLTRREIGFDAELRVESPAKFDECMSALSSKPVTEPPVPEETTSEPTVAN